MKKRIVSAALAVLTVSCLAACSGSQISKPSTSASTVTEKISVTTAFSSTAVFTSTTTLPSTAVQTVTELITTTLKAVTTTKPVTTRATTTVPLYDENKPDGYYDKIQNAFREELKYGVARRRNEINYIETLADGTRLTVKQDITEYYNRFNYKASYSDLLPAAKENKSIYHEMINLELKIINGYRAEQGIAPLRLSDELTEIACARAEEIAWSGKHSHTRPNGRRFASILKDAGITKGIAGENIGWGYDSVTDVCNAWKNSEAHYENIMNPDFVEVGIGIAADPDPDGKLCWTQIFLSE